MKWYDAKKAVPASSIDCVVVTEVGSIVDVPYSNIHRAFNCRDCFATADTAIDVVYWTAKDGFYRDIKKSVEGDESE